MQGTLLSATWPIRKNTQLRDTCAWQLVTTIAPTHIPKGKLLSLQKSKLHNLTHIRGGLIECRALNTLKTDAFVTRGICVYNITYTYKPEVVLRLDVHQVRCLFVPLGSLVQVLDNPEAFAVHRPKVVHGICVALLCRQLVPACCQASKD